MIAYIKDYIDANGMSIDKKPVYSMMLHAEVAIHFNEKVVAGQVKHRLLVL